MRNALLPPPPFPLRLILHVVVDRFLRVTRSPAASETIASMPMLFAFPPPRPNLVAAFAVEVWGHWSSGLRPSNDAHAAMAAMASFLQAQLAVPVVIWACFVVARLFAGHIARRRRATVENLVLMWLYVVGQGLLGLLVVHGFPRVAT